MMFTFSFFLAPYSFPSKSVRAVRCLSKKTLAKWTLEAAFLPNSHFYQKNNKKKKKEKRNRVIIKAELPLSPGLELGAGDMKTNDKGGGPSGVPGPVGERPVKRTLKIQ